LIGHIFLFMSGPRIAYRSRVVDADIQSSPDRVRHWRVQWMSGLVIDTCPDTVSSLIERHTNMYDVMERVAPSIDIPMQCVQFCLGDAAVIYDPPSIVGTASSLQGYHRVEELRRVAVQQGVLSDECLVVPIVVIILSAPTLWTDDRICCCDFPGPACCIADGSCTQWSCSQWHLCTGDVCQRMAGQNDFLNQCTECGNRWYCRAGQCLHLCCRLQREANWVD
jgi:hypothetical protein